MRDNGESFIQVPGSSKSHEGLTVQEYFVSERLEPKNLGREMTANMVPFKGLDLKSVDGKLQFVEHH